MKRIFPFFFLFIMSLNVAVPLVEQLLGVDSCALTEVGTKNFDEKDNSEKEEGKEKEKEKESFTFLDHSGSKSGAFDLKKSKKSLFPKNDHPDSQLYASLPELPPEA